MVKKCNNAPGRIRINAVLRPLLVLLLLIALTAVGCSKKAGVGSDGYFDPGPLKVDQLQLPEVGEEIAVITTDMGVIKMRFFDKVAPKAVENFKKRVQKSYFDGKIFDSIYPNLKIQVEVESDEQTDSTMTELDKPLDIEIDPNYRHLDGSVGFVTMQGQQVQSCFYIVCQDSIEKEQLEVMENMDRNQLSAEMLEAYKAVGGVTRADLKFTVFAQVIYGFDVVKKINNVPQQDNQALAPVLIKKIEIVTFEGR